MNSSWAVNLGEGLTTSNCIKITKTVVISVITDTVSMLPRIYFQVFILLQLLNDIIRNNVCFREYIVKKSSTWLYWLQLILKSKTFK